MEQANDRQPTPIIALTASALKGIGNVSGGRLHGLFDETNQARGVLQAIKELLNSAANSEG